MLAPLVTTKGDVVFVAPPHILKMESGPELPEESGLAPDGKPWPTTIVHFITGGPLHVKGTPSMILNAWYGPAPQQEPAKILTVPPGTRIKN